MRREAGTRAASTEARWSQSASLPTRRLSFLIPRGTSCSCSADLVFRSAALLCRPPRLSFSPPNRSPRPLLGERVTRVAGRLRDASGAFSK